MKSARRVASLSAAATAGERASSTSSELLVGAVAEACGVSVDTIRHYETKGVITGIRRDASGYRRYPPEVIERIRVARKALSIGFTLDELAKIFRQRDAGAAPCRNVQRLAAKKLEELDQRIAMLLELRDSLAATVREWNEKIDGTPDGEKAHLLDGLLKR